MNTPRESVQPTQVTLQPFRVRVWHLSLLVLFVAVAIVNIQDQRRSEPALIALAASGFALYGAIGWLGWRFARRFESRLGPTPLLIAYILAMAAFFLVATVIYLVVEYQYSIGGLRWLGL